MKRYLIAASLCLALTACADMEKFTPSPETKIEISEQREARQAAENAKKEKAAKEAKATHKAFLAKPLVKEKQLNLTARPVSLEAAITASVEEYKNTGKIYPIITPNMVTYPYGLAQPRLTCAALRVCSIALEPGEQVMDVVSGDNYRWAVELAYSGAADAPTPQLMVKPLAEGEISTNLLITTDRRVYDIALESAKSGKYTPRVGFFYPQPLAALSARKKDAPAQEAAPENTAVTVDKLNFGYRVEGGDNLPWKPLGVFDDGTKVFIHMPESTQSYEAPVFLAVGGDGSQQLVNYRVKGGYYIVDRLFTKGVLLLGVGGDAQIVTITRT